MSLRRQVVKKTNFTAGAITPRLRGRTDLRAYANGAADLTNVFIYPTGGAYRRPGLRHVGMAAAGRLVPFQFNKEQAYLFVLTNLLCSVYQSGAFVTSFATPWTAAQLSNIYWTQTADTLLVVHPDVASQKITRTDATTFTVGPWEFKEDEDNDERFNEPFYQFEENIQLTWLASSQRISAEIKDTTTTVGFFTTDYVGVRIRFQTDRELRFQDEFEITEVPYGGGGLPGTKYDTCRAVRKVLGTSNISNEQFWEEQVFSAARGFPQSVAFHQSRLAIGGSKALPNELWLSQTGDLFNFALGDGNDDEAIQWEILSDEVNSISAMFPSRHLQVFTTGAEWFVDGEPLTPTSVQMKRQSRVGSRGDRSIRPVNVDGATIFVSETGLDVREFVFSDVEQAYQATNLEILSEHLITDAIEMDYDIKNRLLHVVQTDGTVATITIFRAEKVSAWTKQTTDGNFKSIAVVGNKTYFLIEKDGNYSVVVLDEDLNTDDALTGTSGSPQTTWSGGNHLEGETVMVKADGVYVGEKTVTSGAITLDIAASAVEFGRDYYHTIEPLPPDTSEARGDRLATKVRPMSMLFRLLNTPYIRVDAGAGYREKTFREIGAGLLDAPPPAYTGVVNIPGQKWQDGDSPSWKVHQNLPYPFALLSVEHKLVFSS